MGLDHFILLFDRSLRTVFAPSVSARPTPGQALPEASLAA